MIELRWACLATTTTRDPILQYRVLTPCVDASGGLCPGTDWTPWKTIPRVVVSDAEIGKA